VTGVIVCAWSDGDGYLSVDTDQWLADRADYDEQLTAHLHEYSRWPPGDDPSGQLVDYHDPHIDRVRAWARQRFDLAEDRAGSYGSMATWGEGDQLLIEELGACWFATETGLIFVEQARGAYGTPIWPRVHRVHADPDCLSDYRTCEALCGHGHRYRAEEGGTQLEGVSSEAPSASLCERVRVPDGDRDRGFVACPSCGQPLSFDMPVW
jgi:hypothetical protein